MNLSNTSPAGDVGQSANWAKTDKMSPRIFYWALTSALAGFLFGFDTVVISGAEQKIQALWHLSDALHGFAMASALYGTVAGALFGGIPSDRFGRKNTLIGIGVLYIIAALGSALATNVDLFILARIIGGLGIGASTVVAPPYIAEISPAQFRGRLTGMFQFNIVFGILVAYGSNALLANVGPDAWRWMLGVAAAPSLIYMLMCFGLPESPRWLLGRKGDRAAGIAVLKLIQPTAPQEEVEAEADQMIAGTVHQASTTDDGGFWSKRLRLPILLAFLIAFFNQMSGINAILYFAPRIFSLAGFKDPLQQSIGIGVTNLIFTFVGLYLIDRLGRRTLLFIGSFGYIASLSLVAFGFFSHHTSIIPVCIFAFIASHAVGQGAVIWVYISEIFPNKYRADGQSLGCGTHWVCAALITNVFPIVVGKFFPGYVFVFFAFMMVLQLIWVSTMVVETKGVSLEEVQERLGVAAA
jgi:MFS transporter, SP family, arabinose:H+ symporter